ncbi:MAG: hypothetical protein RL336_2142 [Pseudomonadota bacterium]|jgi:fructuronate reductase
MKIERIAANYPLENVQPGIVHIGLGAFHRAHQAVYFERFLNVNNGGEWGIVAANIRSNRQLVDDLNDAGNRYHVIEYTGTEHAVLREVRAVINAIFAGDDRTELLDVLCAETTKIITLTVTEKGYCMEPASGRLNRSDPLVLADISASNGVASVPGLLATAFAKRCALGMPGLTVLSCDNMPHNGRRVKAAVLEMAASRDMALADWIKENVTFPCSMVDRIVPAMTEEKRRAAELAFGIEDSNLIETEAFSQWVIEDDFATGRPALEAVGVEFVADVTDYETMKLRLLNGSHSLLAYGAEFLGYDTVDTAIIDEVFQPLVRAYMTETSPSISVDIDIDVYCQSLIDRFANATLNHRLVQIASDGSQKIPQRWLAHIEEACQQGNQLPVTEFALACWMLYMSGTTPDGRKLEINDPLCEVFTQVNFELPAEDIVAAFLSVDAVFPVAFRNERALMARLACYLNQLRLAKTPSAVGELFTSIISK